MELTLVWQLYLRSYFTLHMFEFHTETNTHAALVASNTHTHEYSTCTQWQRPLAMRYDTCAEATLRCVFSFLLLPFSRLHNFNFAYVIWAVTVVQRAGETESVAAADNELVHWNSKSARVSLLSWPVKQYLAVKSHSNPNSEMDSAKNQNVEQWKSRWNLALEEQLNIQLLGCVKSAEIRYQVLMASVNGTKFGWTHRHRRMWEIQFAIKVMMLTNLAAGFSLAFCLWCQLVGARAPCVCLWPENHLLHSTLAQPIYAPKNIYINV